MGHNQVWKTLDSLIAEFKKHGQTVPLNIIEDLRSAKTLMQVLRADPKRAENIPSIEMYLGNIESYLIFEAHKKIGAAFAEDWMQRLREARKASEAEEEPLEPSSKFVSGVPRDQKWVRVQVSDEMPEGKTKELAAECGLSTRIQPDGYLLVYGDDSGIKLFIQKIGEKLQRGKVG
jgi:hypothetical protein